MGVTENVGFNAKVQRIAGIYPWLDRLLSHLLVKKAMVHLQKHKAYNFLHCMPIEALCSSGARLLLLVGLLGCEGGTRREREREPPGMGQSPQRGPGAEPLVAVMGADLRYGGPSWWQAGSLCVYSG